MLCCLQLFLCTFVPVCTGEAEEAWARGLDILLLERPKIEAFMHTPAQLTRKHSILPTYMSAARRSGGYGMPRFEHIRSS